MSLVSVVIPCGRRVRDLHRALSSVAGQRTRSDIEVILVASHADRSTLDAICGLAHDLGTPARVLDVTQQIVGATPGTPLTFFPPAEIAFKRNRGVDVADGDYIAHLDDDNEWTPRHLQALVEAVESSGLEAAHSWRHLRWPDGAAFLEPLYPWMKRPDLASSRHIYDLLVEHGIRHPDSDEVHDMFVGDDGYQWFTVDSSEWLLTRELARSVRFPSEFGFRDLSHSLSDDLLFCQSLYRAGTTQVATSSQCTLRYYLGGRSTSWMLNGAKNE